MGESSLAQAARIATVNASTKTRAKALLLKGLIHRSPLSSDKIFLIGSAKSCYGIRYRVELCLR